MSSKSKPKTQSKTKAKATGGLDESPPAHGRMLPDRKIIISLAKDFDRADVVKESIGEDLKECKASAKDRGVNIKALTDAWKATKRARDDAIGAAIFEEDRAYYLEVLGFDKMIAPSMFKAEDVRSGKKSVEEDEPIPLEDEAAEEGALVH